MDNNIFPTTEQEAQRAANELYEIKFQVKELLNKLNQIEKRLKAISPTIETKKTINTKQPTNRTFSDEHFSEKYEILSTEYNLDKEKTMELLKTIDRDELEGLVKFLGVSTAKKPSQQKLIELTIGRLKESNLLRSERK